MPRVLTNTGSVLILLGILCFISTARADVPQVRTEREIQVWLAKGLFVINDTILGRLSDFEKRTDDAGTAKRILRRIGSGAHKAVVWTDTTVRYASYYKVMHILAAMGIVRVSLDGKVYPGINVFRSNSVRYPGPSDDSRLWLSVFLDRDSLKIGKGDEIVGSFDWTHSLDTAQVALMIQTLILDNRTASDIDEVILIAFGDTPCARVMKIVYILRSCGFSDISYAIAK